MPATFEFARIVSGEQTKALHTYESAIENMLRRMYDQNDANSDFYLHRVALRLPDTAIPDGYRHESHEDASDLTLDDLGEFLAVRYLNVREAPAPFPSPSTPTRSATSKYSLSPKRRRHRHHRPMSSTQSATSTRSWQLPAQRCPTLQASTR